VKIIPIFIPHAGCPYKCVYCDQRKISGAHDFPSTRDVKSIIERNLKTISKNERVEIAFFGGTFTSLPENTQEEYLNAAYAYVKSKKIQGLRMSTHPEAVTKRSMRLFKGYGGLLVEIGVQSLDSGVLKRSKRPVDFKAVRNSASIIRKSGLGLGVQVMLGLPGDTLEKSVKTARRLIRLRPETARVYPAIVLEGTGLGDMFKKGRYRPLSMEDAVSWSAKVCDIFEKANVKVIRVGLHPSEDLNSKGVILAGPYHPSFGEMVRSRQMRDRIVAILGSEKIQNRAYIEVCVSKRMLSLISGHKGAEKYFLEDYYGAPIRLRESQHGDSQSRIVVKVNDIRKDIAVIDPRMPDKAKIRLRQMGYYVLDMPLYPKLAKPVQGHPDMMMFCYGKKVIYEPHLENIASLLMANGYECIKGEKIKSRAYPDDIIYDACGIGKYIICYEGRIEKNIKNLKAGFIKVSQGYVKCSVVPVGDKAIITSDKSIKDIWGDNALLVRPGHIKLPGYKTGFIGGASGVHKDLVFFVGSLNYHPDGKDIREFIEARGKKVIELYDGELFDAGSILFFDH